MAAYPSVTNGSGTTVMWWRPGGAAKKRSFPMRIASIRYSGIAINLIDTTHLGTPAPSGREFGGRTSIPSLFSNPGQLVFEGFFNPNTTLPRDQFFLELVFPLVSGWRRPAKWKGLGFLQNFGDVTITTDDAMKQTVTFQFGDKIVMQAAVKL